MMINTPRTRRIFAGSDAARTAWRTRASPSWAIRLPGRDPSSGRILLPRAVPCIAHYHALTATHNQIPAENGQARSCRAGARRSPTGPALWPGTDPARVMASSRGMPLRHSHKRRGKAPDLVVHAAKNLLSTTSMSPADPAGPAPALAEAGRQPARPAESPLGRAESTDGRADGPRLPPGKPRIRRRAGPRTSTAARGRSDRP